MVKTKRDVQRERTFHKIIESAEMLFADHGIAAVSLRQIGTLAGSLNTNAVGYYVGTKDKLVEAILNYRLPVLETWRSDYLADLDRRGLGMDLKELLRVWWVPLYNLKDKNGHHSFARFLLNIHRAGLSIKRTALDTEYPTAKEVSRRINITILPNEIHNAEFVVRMQLLMITGAMEFIDENEFGQAESDFLFNESLDMLRAALMSRSTEPCSTRDVRN